MSNLTATATGVEKIEELTDGRIAEMKAEIDAIRATASILAKEVATGDAAAIARFTVLSKMISRMEADIAEAEGLADTVEAYSTVTRLKF